MAETTNRLIPALIYKDSLQWHGKLPTSHDEWVTPQGVTEPTRAEVPSSVKPLDALPKFVAARVLSIARYVATWPARR
jgi:hypothetical protein